MPIHRAFTALTLAFTLVATMLFPTPADAAPPPSGRYVDVYEVLQTDAQFEAWYRVTSGLRRDFDEVCGDTFCEGDYSNIQSLRYRCSVDAVSGSIGQCVWVLAGSIEDIDASTGRVVVTGKIWRCRSPIGRLATLDELIRALDVPSPIRAVLPGSGRSLYEGLTDCM